MNMKARHSKFATVGLGAFLILLAAAAPVRGEADYQFIAKLLQSDADSGDHFGEQFAVDGTTLVVSGDDSFGEGAYVFEWRDAGGWQEVSKLTSPEGFLGTEFGHYVAIDGDTLAVSARFDGDGAVYVFERDPTDQRDWNVVQRLRDPAGPGSAGNFASVAIDGDRLAVGAFTDRELAFRSGAVYLYERTPGGSEPWSLTHKLFPSDPHLDKFFGLPLELDGDRLVVGAASDDEVDERAGAAYYFERQGGSWVESQKLTPWDGHFESNFGTSLGLDGETLVVGAYRADAPENESGAAYVFAWDGESWEEGQKLTAADAALGDQFGLGADVRGDVIAVGAPGHDLGKVYLFERSGDLWQESAALDAPDSEHALLFGDFVKLHGHRLFVGDWADGEIGVNTGAVYLFETAVLPVLSVAGSCPGDVTVVLSDASPAQTVALVGSDALGPQPIPAGPCAGVEMGLEDPRLLRTFRADGDGAMVLTRSLAAGFCGRQLQAVDLASCAVSNTAQLPE